MADETGYSEMLIFFKVIIQRPYRKQYAMVPMTGSVVFFCGVTGNLIMLFLLISHQLISLNNDF